MRQRRVTGLDVAVLGALGALFMLVQVFETPRTARFDSYPEPIAALLVEVTADVPVDGDIASSFGALSRSFGQIQTAVDALGPYRGAAVEPLMSLVDINRPALHRVQARLDRARAMSALGFIGEDAVDASPRLLAIAGDLSEHASFRQIALDTAIDIGDIREADIPIVLALLRTADDGLRKSAVEAVAIIGPPASGGLRDVVLALREDDALMRIAAAKALAAIGHAARRTIPDLAAALDDRRPIVRMSVARSLESFGPAAEPAVGALVALLSGDQTSEPLVDDSISEGELGALVDQTIADQGLDPELLRRVIAADRGSNGIIFVRVAAADALASIGPAAADAIPALTAVSQDPDDKVRDAVANALLAIRGR